VRLSDRDREVLYERLKHHAAEGRIGIEELERRIAAIALAETRDAAAAVMADLPPLPGPPPRRRLLRWGRSHGDAETPEPDWHPTGERFRDPRTNKVMRVWVDQAGGRHYVAE
jgi:hypothetical protein